MPKTAALARMAVVLAVLQAGAVCTGSTDDAIDLSPRIEPNSFTRVAVEFDAGGIDLVRAEADAKDGPEKPPAEQKLPMSVSARLLYDELRLTGAASAGSAQPTMLAIRFYERAEAVLKVDTTGLAPKLAEDRRLIVVESGASRPILYCPQCALPRAELDLIDIVGNPCLIDQLLPTSPVAKDGSWGVDSTTMGGLLTLDSVAVCEVQCVLDEFNANFAKIRLAGVVHGTADGAATQQEVRGVCLFDRRLRRITRFNLAVREQRSIGAATPGLQGVAKMQIKIEPIEGSPRLTEKVVADARSSHRAARQTLLYESPTLGFRVEHDRQWFITSEARETLTLRRVDRSDVVAQCTATRLPSRSLGRQISLEQFQKDVAFSLGRGFGQLVSSRQWMNAHGHHCFEVVVRGTVAETPVEWHHYLVAQPSGHRVSLAFTIEGPLTARLDRADRQLVDAIQLLPPAPAATAARQDDASAK